ncbi:hypothetical protein [Arthrobacter sp. Soil762]|uniref:hypothetical protein n=1 Tax=Arthrobacter sp. Soil762 TaxID=1736401 RepID=UPI0006FDE5B4|nr:hypothetical protein [Arthrobacter sp. Soil762]KRE71630.1 hypothetical protein ASG77_11450 [Arthrobacter sp. Soil762]
MKNRGRLHHVRLSENSRALGPRTGEHCPVNGWWAPLEGEGDARFITEGTIMPSVNGAPGLWTLTVRPAGRGYAASAGPAGLTSLDTV